MSTPTSDSSKSKASQVQSWDHAAAGWKKWWETFEQAAQSASDRLVELAQVRNGQRVLDVATGIGEPAITAARLVGPGGRVVATDISGQMLAIARERAARLGLTNLDFVQGDAESLDLPQESFEGAFSRWAFMFFPNPGSALARLRLLLVPGGYLATALWSSPARVPVIAAAATVINRELNLPAPASGDPGLFKLAEPHLMEGMMKDAGFRNIQTETISVNFKFASPEDFTAFTQDISAPLVVMLMGQNQERRTEIWAKVTQAVAQYATSDGSISMPSESIFVVGQR